MNSFLPIYSWILIALFLTALLIFLVLTERAFFFPDIGFGKVIYFFLNVFNTLIQLFCNHSTVLSPHFFIYQQCLMPRLKHVLFEPPYLIKLLKRILRSLMQYFETIIDDIKNLRGTISTVAITAVVFHGQDSLTGPNTAHSGLNFALHSFDCLASKALVFNV